MVSGLSNIMSSFFKVYFIDYAITVVPIFPPLLSSTWYSPSLQQSCPLSSCPGVLHISSLISPFPVLSLTFLCLFCTYQICFVFPVPFPPFSPFPLPADNPPSDLPVYDSVPVLVVFLVHFCFLDSVIDSCEFVAFLMSIVLISYFLTKSF